MVQQTKGFALREWGWAALGCLSVVAAACGVALLSGTSVVALQQIVLLNALQHVGVHFTALTLSAITVIWSIPVCAAGLVVAYSTGSGKWRRVSLVLQRPLRVLLVAGIVRYFQPCAYVPLDLPGQFSIYELALPLLWIGLVPAVEQIGFRERVVRNLSVLIAIFHALVVYPVSGTQVGLAAVLFMPVWGFALHDTLVGLAAALPAGGEGKKLLLARIATALVAVALLAEGWNRVLSAGGIYRSEMPLGLPGSTRLRIDQPTAGLYRFLTANLRQPGRTFFTMPGMFSLHFWAEKAPPTGLNATDWMVMLSDQQQQQVVELINTDKDLWVVVQPVGALRLAGGQPIQNKPLVKFVRVDCQRINAVGGMEVGKRAGQGPADLVQCVHWGVLDATQSQSPQNSLQLICRMPVALSHVPGSVVFTYIYPSGVSRALRATADATPLAAMVIIDLRTGKTVATSYSRAEGTAAATRLIDPRTGPAAATSFPDADAGTVTLLVRDEAAGKVRTVMPFPPVDLREGDELCFSMRVPVRRLPTTTRTRRSGGIKTDVGRSTG